MSGSEARDYGLYRLELVDYTGGEALPPGRYVLVHPEVDRKQPDATGLVAGVQLPEALDRHEVARRFGEAAGDLRDAPGRHALFVTVGRQEVNHA
jgi:hypothetical protein